MVVAVVVVAEAVVVILVVTVAAVVAPKYQQGIVGLVVLAVHVLYPPSGLLTNCDFLYSLSSQIQLHCGPSLACGPGFDTYSSEGTRKKSCMAG